MKTQEFKNYLKENKSELIGNTLTVIYKDTEHHFETLNAFSTYLLSILDKNSHCSILFTNMFLIMDKRTMVKLKPLTEKERTQGIANTLQRWGTTE